MRVVVTGGAGFIGANLCRALGATGVEHVVAFDDLSTGAAENLDGVDGTELVVGSVLDSGALDAAFRGANAVVHLAARPSVPRSLADPVASHEVNATGTVRVLEAARRAGGCHTIVASSSSVYGANPALPKREDLVPMPVSPYAVSKLAAESYALSWSRSFGLPVLAMRFFNVFGPLQPAGHAYAAVIPTFLAAALAGKPITIHGDGFQTRDFTYVDSVTRLLCDAVARRVTHDGPVNLAFGTRLPLLDIVAMIERLLGRTLERVHTPERPGDVRDSQADPALLRSLFPGCASTSIDDGLAATVAWFTARLAQPSVTTPRSS